MNRTDAVEVSWYPEFRDGAAVPIAVSMKIGEHRFVPIDPADRKTANKIAQRAASAAGVDPGVDISAVIDAVQAALRSLIEPPKPEEPQGLGAVVEDAEERVYVRYPREGAHSANHWHDGTNAFKWDEIRVVKVLSEGVVTS